MVIEKTTSAFHSFFEARRCQALKWHIAVDGAMLAILGFTFAFPITFHIVLIFVSMVLVGVLLGIYSSFSAVMDKDDQARVKCRAALQLGIAIFFVFFIGAPIRRLQYTIRSEALTVLWLMAVVVTIVVSAMFLLSHKADRFYEKLDGGLMTALTGKKAVCPGDIVLCDIKDEVVKKTKDPREILPAKDRFLHMLILGPTGCGKTSQIILPMVRQDIQNTEWGVTILEPKGDLAIKAAMMAEYYKREFIYFDPSFKNCPKFNPLAGREVDVVENIATTFKMLNPDSPQFFLDLNEQLVRNAVKVLKRLDRDAGIEGKYATLINLGRLLQNSGSSGREMVNMFSKISAPTDSEAKENADIAAWFLNDYFPERSKVYENTSGVRSQVSKLISNEYLREVLNPDINKGEKNTVNFDKHLMQGGVICISTAQGALRDLSKYLGYFLILSFQSAVFRRPGTEDTRRPHSLYIDEFQTYSTPGFSDMLTQGRSYRVSSILATQARAQMAMGGGRDGKNFVELVSANARNVVLFPGLNKDDAKYYSDQFGEYEKTEVMTGITRKTFNPLMGGFDRLGHPSETIREQKKMTANFTTTDLIFGQEIGSSFGEIVYSIIKNSSIQPARVGKISYIPKDINDILNTRILEYSEQYARESAAEYALQEDSDSDDSSEDEPMLSFPDDGDLADLGGEDEMEFTPPPEPAGASGDDYFDSPELYSDRGRDDIPIDWSSPSELCDTDGQNRNSADNIFDDLE